MTKEELEQNLIIRKDLITRKAVLDTLEFADKVLDEDRTIESYKKLLIACYEDLPSPTTNLIDISEDLKILLDNIKINNILESEK